jgi:hypothetical protein
MRTTIRDWNPLKTFVAAVFFLAAVSDIASFFLSHQTRLEFGWQYLKYVYYEYVASPSVNVVDDSTGTASEPAAAGKCLQYGFRTLARDCEAPGVSTTERLVCKAAPREGEIYCRKRAP